MSKLLESAMSQTQVPDEVLIIDGSADEQTTEMLENLHRVYFQGPSSDQNHAASIITPAYLDYHKVPLHHHTLP